MQLLKDLILPTDFPEIQPAIHDSLRECGKGLQGVRVLPGQFQFRAALVRLAKVFMHARLGQMGLQADPEGRRVIA